MSAQRVNFRLLVDLLRSISSSSSNLIEESTNSLESIFPLILADSGNNQQRNEVAITVTTYAAMLALGVPTIKTDYKVTFDENYGGVTTRYEYWPDGDIINIVGQKTN